MFRIIYQIIAKIIINKIKYFERAITKKSFEKYINKYKFYPYIDITI